MEGQMMLHHVGFVVGDLTRSVDFYTKILDFELHDRWKETPDMCEMGYGIPGATLELAQLVGHGFQLELIQFLVGTGSAEEISPNHIGVGHISLGVEDFSGLVRRLQENKVPFASDIVRLKTGQWVHFFDPDGIRVEIMGRL